MVCCFLYYLRIYNFKNFVSIEMIDVEIYFSNINLVCIDIEYVVLLLVYC